MDDLHGTADRDLAAVSPHVRLPARSSFERPRPPRSRTAAIRGHG
ncbi:hypothetical protein [Kribbella sp.]|nr:hypothetical protein [Kribbella sp.]HZX07609.1 hypothetical protein [Kribbella sp.]